jgi:hypothetical protein
MEKLDSKLRIIPSHVDDAKAVEMHTAEGRGLLARWVAFLEELVVVGRKVQSAVRSQDPTEAESALKRYAKVQERETKLGEDLEQLCGSPELTP